MRKGIAWDVENTLKIVWWLLRQMARKRRPSSRTKHRLRDGLKC